MDTILPISHRSRYSVVSLIGSGAYGFVYHAIDMVEHCDVAIKHVQLDARKAKEYSVTIASDARRIVRELTLHHLVASKSPASVVRMRDVFNAASSADHRVQDVFMVLDKYEMDASVYIRRVPQSIHNFGQQMKTELRLLRKLVFDVAKMHRMKVVHRDIKPANILVRTMSLDADNVGVDSSVLCDMGMSRVMSSDPEDSIMWTDYVTTRWYRAPEMCDQFVRGRFSTACDVWSLGCIIFEMAARTILFPGMSAESQLLKITTVLGQPPASFVEEHGPAKGGCQHIFQMLSGADCIRDGIEKLVNRYSAWDLVSKRNLVTLLNAVLRWNPKERLSAEDMLRSPLFDAVRHDEDWDMGVTGSSGLPSVSSESDPSLDLLAYDNVCINTTMACELVYNTSHHIQSIVNS
jgi:serine/threonine protein kinase